MKIRGGAAVRKRFPWLAVAVVFLVLAVVLWFGGGWLWHALLRMHGIERH
jgi:hypothetical protein